MLTLGKKTLSVPILQGGMGVGVSLGGLAGAVAACGGMGCISTADAGYREPDFARDPVRANHRALAAEIRKAKDLAKGAGMVAINAMVATQDYAAAIRTAVEAGVDAVVSGAGLPLELPGLVNTPDVAIAPIVSSGRAAKLILRRWAKAFGRTADFVVIEGCKAGGHLGFSEEELLAGACQTLDDILPEVLAEVRPYEAQFGHPIPVFVAGGVRSGGGRILGVAPRFFNVDGVLYDACTEFIYTDTMRERKQIMEDRSDAVIMTPGGIGTFEEYFEMLTLKQLGRHSRPIAVFNVGGYFDELLQMLEKAAREQFMQPAALSLSRCFTDAEAMLDYIEAGESAPVSVESMKNI